MGKAAQTSWTGRARAGLAGLGGRRQLAVAAAVVVSVPMVLGLPAASAAPAFRSLPGKAPSSVRPALNALALANPPQNVPRTPAMAEACSAGPAACQAAVVGAIDQARAAEGVGPLLLPPDFGSLSSPVQLLVLADLERTDRGLPGFTGLSAGLDSLSAKGASADTDPEGPDNTDWGSNWAGGEQNALLADYDWMYDDGPGSPNLDCPKPGASGCWDHRENILWNYGPHPSMGAAATQVGGVTSMTELFSSAGPGVLDTSLPPGTGKAAADVAAHPISAGPAAAPQRAVTPKRAHTPASAPTGSLVEDLQPLAVPAQVIPLHFQLDGVPAAPVTRLIKLSAPVSGFGLRAPLRK